MAGNPYFNIQKEKKDNVFFPDINLPVSLMNPNREMFLLSGREIFLDFDIGKKDDMMPTMWVENGKIIIDGGEFPRCVQNQTFRCPFA